MDDVDVKARFVLAEILFALEQLCAPVDTEAEAYLDRFNMGYTTSSDRELPKCAEYHKRRQVTQDWDLPADILNVIRSVWFVRCGCRGILYTLYVDKYWESMIVTEHFGPALKVLGPVLMDRMCTKTLEEALIKSRQ